MINIRVYTAPSVYREVLVKPSDTLYSVLGDDLTNFAYIYYPQDKPPSIGSPLYQTRDGNPDEYAYTIADYNITHHGTSIMVSHTSLSELDQLYRYTAAKKKHNEL
jgi:hypothetical protein